MTAQAAVDPQAVAAGREAMARYVWWTGEEARREEARKEAWRQRCVALADLRKLGLTLDELGELIGKSRERARQMIASVDCDEGAAA